MGSSKGMTRRLAAWLGAAALAAALAGCGGEPEIVKPLKTDEEVRAEQAERARARRDAPARETRRGQTRGEAGGEPAPTPRPRATPRPDARAAETTPTQQPPPPPPPVADDNMLDHTLPIELTMSVMRADAGSSDTEGGWSLNTNGMVYVMGVPVTFPIHALGVEARGQAAEGTWPMVELTFYNRERRAYYYPMNKVYVTWAEYRDHHIPLDPPLPPGEYQISFRFLNNETPGTQGDRNVHFRKLVLYPKQALAERE